MHKMIDPMKLIELCGDGRIWIQTHNFPDPDAIASAFGLQQLLQHFQIESRLCYEGVIDKLSSKKMLTLGGITMLSPEERNLLMEENDKIILVDCQKENGNTTDLIGNEIAAIDHHPTYYKVDYLYSDLRITGSCASMIAEYYQMLGIHPSQIIATILLYGMRMDTLGLKRGVTDLDVSMYRFLFQHADQKLLNDLESNNMEFSDLQGYAEAIQNIRVYGRVGFSYLGFSCTDALVAILGDFLLNLAEVDVVVIYSIRKDGYKFSFRSIRDELPAGNLAKKGIGNNGSGGGHASMAGGIWNANTLETDPGKFYELVQARFLGVIREDFPEILGE